MLWLGRREDWGTLVIYVFGTECFGSHITPVAVGLCIVCFCLEQTYWWKWPVKKFSWSKESLFDVSDVWLRGNRVQALRLHLSFFLAAIADAYLRVQLLSAVCSAWRRDGVFYPGTREGGVHGS